MPVYELDTDQLIFPHPELAEEDGLLAFGGDLSIDRLLLAYSNGIFPWYSEGQPIMWWSPNPRMLLLPQNLRVSKSLRRTVRQGRFSISSDQAFAQVIRACAEVPREGQDSTWITGEMITAYQKLHQAGYAHSFESWYEGKLVGGLYGVSIGKAFFGESMFHTMTDASKVAFFHFADHLQSAGFHFIDAQMHTRHLERLGAKEVPLKKYLRMTTKAITAKPPAQNFWKNQQLS